MKILPLPTDSALTHNLITQVNTRLAELTLGEKYTVANILGQNFWNTRPTIHRALGQCFSKLVSDGRTPFIATGLTRNRHNEYRYTPDQ